MWTTSFELHTDRGNLQDTQEARHTSDRNVVQQDDRKSPCKTGAIHTHLSGAGSMAATSFNGFSRCHTGGLFPNLFPHDSI